MPFYLGHSVHFQKSGVQDDEMRATLPGADKTEASPVAYVTDWGGGIRRSTLEEYRMGVFNS